MDGLVPEEHHVFGDFADENQVALEEQRKQLEKERLEIEQKQLLKYYFPKFQRGKVLSLMSIVPKQVSRYQWQRDLYLTNRHIRPLIPLKLRIEVQPDSRRTFKSKGKSWQSMAEQQKRKKAGIVTVPLDNMYGEEMCIRDSIYTVAWPLTSMDLDLLSIFVKPDACSIKWVFLLDWLQGNKKLWLRDLCEALELVRHKLGRDPCDIDSCSIITMQSQCCKDLEISSASWSSLKMEFMNQALRLSLIHI